MSELYVGLMSLDSDTLAFWAANSKALDLDTPEAGVLAAFGRSIHVRGRTIVVPGGPAYAPVWVRLVDRRLDEPVEFIRRLLSKDDGRLAYLYDTVAHLAQCARRRSSMVQRLRMRESRDSRTTIAGSETSSQRGRLARGPSSDRVSTHRSR